MIMGPGHYLRIGVLAELLFPCRPAPGVLTLVVEVLLQSVVDCNLLQALTALIEEVLELQASVGGVALVMKTGLVEHDAENAELVLKDSGVVNILLCAQGPEFILELIACHNVSCLGAVDVLRNLLDVDVRNVEPAAA